MMKRVCITVIAALALIACSKEEPKIDLSNLEGTWCLLSYHNTSRLDGNDTATEETHTYKEEDRPVWTLEREENGEYVLNDAYGPVCSFTLEDTRIQMSSMRYGFIIPEYEIVSLTDEKMEWRGTSYRTGYFVPPSAAGIAVHYKEEHSILKFQKLL